MIESSFRRPTVPGLIGAWSGLAEATAAALGPLVGGYLVGAVSWRAIFLINLPIGVFVVLMAPRHVPETRDPTASGHLDSRRRPGAVGLAGVTYALIEAPGQGLSPSILLTGIGGLAAFAAFLATERRSANPMLPLSMFSFGSSAPQTAGATFVVYAAPGRSAFSAVSFLQISLGYSPIEAGAASLPITVLMLLLSARSGALAQRIGADCSQSARW